MKKFHKRLPAFLLTLLLTAVTLCLRGAAPAPESSPGAVQQDATDYPLLELYAADPAKFARDERTGIEYVRDLLMVYFAPTATQNQKESAVRALQGTAVGKADVIGRWTLAVKGENLAALEALRAKAAALPGVAGAALDHVAAVESQYVTTNDPWVSDTFPDAAANRWYLEAIQAPEAWELNDRLQETPCIGLVDEGILLTHEDLAGVNIMPFLHVTTPSVFGGHDYYYAHTPTAHGTALASVVAAKANNGKGLAGLCRDAKIVAFDWKSAYNALAQNPLPVPDAEALYITESALFDGLLLCAMNGARAINFSVGRISNDVNAQYFSLTEEMQHAYAEASSLFLAQMLSYSDTMPQFSRFVIVQSAGNQRNLDAKNNGYFACVTPENTGQPADIAQKINDLILVVGGLQQESTGAFKQWTFTANNYNGTSTGAQIDLYAPAASVFSAANAEPTAYNRLSGTSVAAPMVASTAALMSAANPALKGWEIGAMLKTIAVSPRVVRDRTITNYSLYPMLHMRNALLAAVGPGISPVANAPCLVDTAARQIVLDSARTAAAAVASALQAEGVAAALSYQKAVDAPENYAATGDSIAATDALGQSANYSIVVPGDLNGDGRANGYDAQLLDLYLAGRISFPTPEDALLAAADYNGDGVTDHTDFIAIAQAGILKD
ncbi:MAG: S8 family serine peptidase [Oscillospiraceae bacterium]|nr:S8 family serine peptidase [Oscillospiraceae bacterium]